MLDICDRQYVQSDPMFRRNLHALQIILNTDDIELVNPIGTHTKKTQIDNVLLYTSQYPSRPEIKTACYPTPCCSKNKRCEERWAWFIVRWLYKNMRKLWSDEGLNMTVNGINLNLQGKLIIAPCDTLAANWLGCFKEGLTETAINSHEKTQHTSLRLHC